MNLEIECKRCQARYRVKEELAGRMVQCKRCGQRFVAPARPAVVQLGEEDEVGEIDQEGAAEAEQGRTFEEYGVAGGGAKRAGAVCSGGPLMRMPHEVSDVWLPIGVALLCYGVAAYRVVRVVLAGNGPVVGLILLGAMGVAYAWVMTEVGRVVDGEVRVRARELAEGSKEPGGGMRGRR